MPVRSLRSLMHSVWCWPTPEQVLHQVKAWAVEQKQIAPELQRWSLEQLPLSCDVRVLTPAELQHDLRWLP